MDKIKIINNEVINNALARINTPLIINKPVINSIQGSTSAKILTSENGINLYASTFCAKTSGKTIFSTLAKTKTKPITNRAVS